MAKKVIKTPKTPKAATKIVSVGSSQVKGFIEFIRSQGVMGLAVGLVLGTAVTVLVRSMIDNIIMPPIGYLMGSADGLKGLTLVIGKTADGEPAILSYGVFLNDLVNFVVIAFVVYMIVKLFNVEVKK